MDDKAAVLADVCAALSGNQSIEAGAILQERYPFVPLVKTRGPLFGAADAYGVFPRRLY
jgi:hypothetical protein